MQRRPQIIQHGPRRRILRPWRRVCQCGLAAWPCPVKVLLARQAEMLTHRRESIRLNNRPAWDHPTPAYQLAPLLTPAQYVRTRQRDRW